MKTIVFFLVVICLFTECKKDKSSGTKETVLTKVIKNGKLTDEFVYSKKRMIRANAYDEITGEFDYATGFEYDLSGKLVKENEYSQPNKIGAQIIYTWGADGKISQHEYKSLSGNDSGQIVARVKYDYDALGRINKLSWVDLVTDETVTTNVLTYYSNGNLRSSAIYYHYNPLPTLQWETNYSAGEPLPQSLSKFQGYPINFLLYDLVAGERHFYYYGNGIVTKETNDIFTNRLYNEKGYLMQQTIKQKTILPAAPDKLIQMEYEYAEL
jgi:hypothetical protein